MIDWQPYVLAPDRPLQEPVAIVSASGGVEDPRTLTANSEPITLRYRSGDAEPPVVVLDYGREVGGYPAFSVRDVEGSPDLRSSYSETRRGLRADGDYAGRKRLTRVQVQPVDGEGPLASQQIEGGQRYVRLTLTEPGEVRLDSAAIRYSAYRGTPRRLRGYFLSSDDLLNRIWYAGVYTLNLNQVPGDRPVLIDGAKRDRKIWSGDLLTSGPSVFYSLPPQYVRGSLATLAAGRQVPLPGKCFPDGTECQFYSAAYSMAWVVALHDYYRFTGDRAFVRPLLALMRRQLEQDARRVGPNGLYEVTFRRGKNWNLERYGGELTYVNAMYHLALVDGASLLEAFGDDGDALRARAKAISTAVNDQLWDDARGVYDISTLQRGMTAQDANVMAALSGLAPTARTRRLLPALDRALASPVGPVSMGEPLPEGFRPVVSPYMGGLQMQADFQADRTSAALELMRTEWGWMLGHAPGGTFWEKMSPTGFLRPSASGAHAWSTAPTSALSRFVLGAAPADAGWKTWTVRPQPGDVRWAQGSVPTPRGDLSVSWTRNGGGFSLRVTAPERTRGTVLVPLLGGKRSLERDGRRATPKRSGGYAVFPAQSGTHTYAW